MLSPNRIKTLLGEISATFDLIEGLLERSSEDWRAEFGHHAFYTKDELKDRS